MIPEPLSLEGRAALVTGAGSVSGIGFACAQFLGALGASVTVTSTTNRIHDRATELQAMGVTAHGVVADLTAEADVQRVAIEAVSAMGTIDILVNNAGMTSVSVPDEGGDAIGIRYGTWRSSIERNLDTAFLMSQTVLPHMIRGSWGRIVSIASVTGPAMAMRNEAACAAAKAGVVGLMRSIALDYAPHGVTANAVAPGWIETGSQTSDEASEGLASPVGRSGTPEEVAAAVAWLASPGAAYTTGQCIIVDGGNSISEQRR